MFNPATGDYFLDHIGKYCSNDYINQVIFPELEHPPIKVKDVDSNQSCENIPEESEEKDHDDEKLSIKGNAGGAVGIDFDLRVNSAFSLIKPMNV